MTLNYLSFALFPITRATSERRPIRQGATTFGPLLYAEANSLPPS